MTAETATEQLERRRRVEQLGNQIAIHLSEIRRLYREPVVITLIVRAPGHPDGRRDTVMTDDPDPAAAVQCFSKSIRGEDCESYTVTRG